MATILPNFNSGGSNSAPNGSGSPSLALVLRDIADDLTTLRSALNAVVTKLNADAGVTDVDYAAAAALKTIKG